MVREVILGLYSLGLRKGDRVGILSENRVERLCADAATQAGGFPNVVVSPSLSDSMILRLFTHSGARAVFMEHGTALGRVLNLKGQLPALDHMIVMDPIKSPPAGSLDFERLRLRGRKMDANRLGTILESVHPDELAAIIYTSGSTGEPKGVMRTHRNLLSNIQGGTEILPGKPDALSLIALSLNHFFGRFSFLKSMASGRTTAIVDATDRQLDLGTIQVFSPTAMSLVPRIMAIIWSAILADGDNQHLWEVTERLDQVRAEHGSLSAEENQQYEAAKGSLGRGVRKALGGRIKYISYGGAAMAPRILRFFRVIGVPLLGAYGSTECGGVTLSGLDECKPGNLGKPFPNVEVRMADDGEVLVRGPAVTPGYYGNPEATREVLGPDGWFHSGDLGSLDADGSLRIIGRKNDIFNCSEGSNIYPGYIELLLENDPVIRQAILVGDGRPFIAALLVPDRGKIAAELKKAEVSLTDGEIETVLWLRVEKINARLEHYEKVRKIAVLKRDFPEEVRSVTAFQKLKIDRKQVEKFYGKEIRVFYPCASVRSGT